MSQTNNDTRQADEMEIKKNKSLKKAKRVKIIMIKQIRNRNKEDKTKGIIEAKID